MEPLVQQIAVPLAVAMLGVIITSNKNTRDVQAKLDKQQSITETKLEELTREVREHNNFARRVPVLEEQIKVINHRIAESNAWSSGLQKFSGG